ncbi:MAG: ABC transporter permease [Saprospiraceae bacterium]|nr:ABC transporter permease [Saprospiraceae bacterium]
MILTLSRKNILHRPLNALLAWLLLTCSVAIISLVLLLQGQFQQKFEASVRGIDLVLGAKGSPLQLILSAVYHLDNPTGNIDYAEAQKWMNNRMVKSAIPLAYGDSYQGFAMVGTTPAYLEQYTATLVQGRIFQQNFEVVIGAEIARKGMLSLGQNFFSTHGAAAEGEEHHEHAYRVAGVLAYTGTVLDNLILSDIESVWAMHDHETEEKEHGAEQGESHETEEHAETEMEAGHVTSAEGHRKITAVLFTFHSPMAMVQWPRMVAQQTDMQMASPAIEVNRIFSLFGIGIDALTWLGWAIMVLAALSVFVALFNTLKERRYELALLRTLGGSRIRLLCLLLLESLWLCAAGFASGILLSRLAFWFISQAAEREYRFSLDQFGFQWPGEGWLLLLALGIGLIAALFPALKAYRLDISKTLADV